MTNEISIAGARGYELSVLTNVCSRHSSILLCLHGFCGDKNSSVIAELMKCLNPYGIGVVTFDWPAHGASTAKDEELTVENCLSDIDTILQYIRREYSLPLSCFATSFGGYLATLYRNAHSGVFQKTVLRSPALKMPQIFLELLSEEERMRFLKGEAITVGFERKIQLKLPFYESLRANRAFDAPVEYPGQVLILQGDQDDVVRPADTALYAERSSIRLEWFRGSDHRYKKQGDLQRIVELTREFLLSACGPA